MKNILTLVLVLCLIFLVGLEYMVWTLPSPQFPKVQFIQKLPILEFNSEGNTGIYMKEDGLIYYVFNGEYIITLPLCEIRLWKFR